MAQPTLVKDMPPLPPEEVVEDGGVNGNGITKTFPNDPATTASAAHSPPREEQADKTVATLSSPWTADMTQPYCTECHNAFTNFNRRHHCRMCGKIFCNNCSDQRSLIPPTSIVLVPKGGKKALPPEFRIQEATFSPDEDPDRMLTYTDGDTENLLYGKGLEERTKLAREPLRVCHQCHGQLAEVQEELRNSNSNAMRFNHIDPTDPRRLLNSPLAFTLGHEIRKAAYTLNNLLPLPKRMGAFVPSSEYGMDFHADTQQCKEQCSAISPTLGDLDGVRIPVKLLEQAKGVAVLTVVKGGFGLAGFEFGTGLVVARLANGEWSAPSALGTGGISWGALIGAQVSDHVFLLMTDASVELMFSNDGSVQLGADVGVALGPVGRSVEAELGASVEAMAPIYTYSLSKGLYAGISLNGSVIVSRHKVNEKFYGKQVSGHELLQGQIPTPQAAQPLYDALKRCHVYAEKQQNLRSSGRHPHQQLGVSQTRDVSHAYDYSDFVTADTAAAEYGPSAVSNFATSQRLVQPPPVQQQQQQFGGGLQPPLPSSTQQQQQQHPRPPAQTAPPSLVASNQRQVLPPMPSLAPPPPPTENLAGGQQQQQFDPLTGSAPTTMLQPPANADEHSYTI